MNGQAWVTASPYFYATNKVSLDANSMRIHEVSLDTKPLAYEYNEYVCNLEF